MEFQGRTTTPQGRPALEANSNAMKAYDSCTVRAQSSNTDIRQARLGCRSFIEKTSVSQI